MFKWLIIELYFVFFQGINYEKHRPTYTNDLVNHVIESLHTVNKTGTQYDILEIGAGTGKFTRKMFDQLKTPFRYLAIEPSDDFYKFFQKLCPYAEVKQYDAAHLPLPNVSVQNIICAQCFHRFDNKESLNEMSRVLVPGGRMLCI